MQKELTQRAPLLTPDGKLSQAGWSRQPVLDCNLENVHLTPWRGLDALRVKRWDYYAVFTPQRFFSFTIANLGYAGNVFAYTLDYESGELYEEGLVTPFGRGIRLPRNSQKGNTSYEGKAGRMQFQVTPHGRQVQVEWPGYHKGRGIKADFQLQCPPQHESMTIATPMEKGGFYYNRKINCMPTLGFIQYGDQRFDLQPQSCLGSLDWGRGVWPYRSFWNWASASGFLPDGRTVGLNLGRGFGDLSAATENCLILNGRIHKLEGIDFIYDKQNFTQPWKFCDTEGRLELEFVPFKERVARTDLKIIDSEVHQLFGRYTGLVTADSGEAVYIENLVGFAEDHRARW